MTVKYALFMFNLKFQLGNFPVSLVLFEPVVPPVRGNDREISVG